MCDPVASGRLGPLKKDAPAEVSTPILLGEPQCGKSTQVRESASHVRKVAARKRGDKVQTTVITPGITQPCERMRADEESGGRAKGNRSEENVSTARSGLVTVMRDGEFGGMIRSAG
jgi:hypothetical protein